MAVIKVVNSRASIGNAIKYVTQKEKTEDRLITGKDCNPYTAIDEMKATKELFNKLDGRQYKHYVQSFAPGEVSKEKAHQIGRELAEKNFKGYEVLISTHTDKGHIHNHLIVNSVSFEDGKKFQQSKRDLDKLKKHSDRICEREGLSVIREKSDRITTFDQNKYKAIEKGFNEKQKSYLLDTAKDVSNALKKATDRDSFIKDLETKGYKVNWKDTRKHITFTTPEGKKVRNTNLEKTFKEHKFSKEGMENEIQRNRGQRARENVNWREVATNIEHETSRISKQSSNEITRELQQQVRDIQERTSRATGENWTEDRTAPRLERDSNKEHQELSREHKPQVRERSFELER